MEVKNILIADSSGELSEELFKHYPDRSAVSAWFDEVDGTRSLKLSTNNIKFDSIPNLNRSTYVTFLAYNGTLGYNKKVFSTVVKEEAGIFNVNEAPVMTYNPNELEAVAEADLEDKVLDIKMYNGQVDVLEYKEGILKDGQTTYRTKATRSYPTTITSLPNVTNQTIHMDGWYSYTQIVFRHIEIGALVSKGTFYGFEGFIFKASHDGYFYSNESTGVYFILPEGQTLITQGIAQEVNTDYEELLFSLNEGSGVSAQSNHVYLHSQVLVSDELRNAITKEIVTANYNDKNGCDFADWQKLMLKRYGASVMFENELYENAQIIMESARRFCSSGEYESKC